MRVVFAGTPETALPSLEAIAASRHELAGVVTRPDAAQGRSRRLVPSPVAEWAMRHDLPVLRPPRTRDERFAAELAALQPDCCPVVAYGGLIPDHLLQLPPAGWVNLHFSLLPAWRGAAPVQRAIMAGDQTTGVSVFQIVTQLDAGPVYRQETSLLDPGETAGDVLARLADDGARVLVEVLDGIAAGGLDAVPQPDTGITLAPKLTTAEAELDWTREAVHLDRVIRACNPSPMAWTTLAGQRLRILLAEPLDSAGLRPGVADLGRRQVSIGTGSGDLRLLQVQAQGKRPMAALDWARGLRTETVVLGS